LITKELFNQFKQGKTLASKCPKTRENPCDKMAVLGIDNGSKDLHTLKYELLLARFENQ